MDKPFDPTKPCTTRDGRPARVLCTDMKDHRNAGRMTNNVIVALITNGPSEHVATYYIDGTYSKSGKNEKDLVNVPERKSIFRAVRVVNGAPVIGSALFVSVEQARAGLQGPWDGVVEYVIEDGAAVVDTIFHKFNTKE